MTTIYAIVLLIISIAASAVVTLMWHDDLKSKSDVFKDTLLVMLLISIVIVLASTLQ